jgi:hypothetical protein
LSAVDILKEPADPEQKSALSEAKEFLLQVLGEGPVAAEGVKKDARGAGVSERTLKRAKRALGVGSKKEGDGSWNWILPVKEAAEGHAPAAGTLGTVGPLNKNANPESANWTHEAEEGQGCQEGQRDHEPSCIHDFSGGAGCYLCDSKHPYRLEHGG